jgi:capsular polysaccharide biosynthesis protein
VTEQPLDLQRVVRALRRGIGIIGVCLGVGVVASLFYTVIRPPLYHATALVLLPASAVDSTGQPSRNINTEVQVAASGDVLTIAAGELRPKPHVSELKDHLKVTAPTPDILEFTAKAASGGRAIAAANAIADGYRQYSASGATAQLDKIIGALNASEAQLKVQVSRYQTEIDTAAARLATLPPNSPQASSEAGLITSLQSQQNDAAAQLIDIQNQAAAAKLSTDVNSSGIKVLERASSATNSAAKSAVLNLGSGIILGLLLGASIVLAREGRDRRLRLRDDIARAAGAPIVAAIATRRVRDADEWLALFENYEASADEGWSLRRAVRSLLTADAEPPAGVTIVTMAGDTAAVAIAPQLAVFAAASGVRTLLVVTGRDPSVATLRQACREAQLTIKPARTNLWIREAQPGERVESDAAQLVVTVAVTEQGTLDLEPDRPSTVLLGVSAGEATPEAIAAVAAAAAGAKRPLAGVIVANPEADDGTTGRIAEPSTPGRRLAYRRLRTQPGSAS